MGIYLSKKFGVNSTMTFCPQCGRDSNELLFVGRATEYECGRCHGKIIGKQPKGDCPHCGATGLYYTRIGEFDGSRRRLPASDICDKCKKELKELKEEIAKGGVPWKCDICKSEGAIRSESNFAKNFRKEHPKAGIILDKDNCPVCSKE